MSHGQLLSAKTDKAKRSEIDKNLTKKMMPRISMNILRHSLPPALGLLSFASILAAGDPPPNWPQFRGPGGQAVGAEDAVPVQFTPESNVVWRVELPPGHSSPCIWGERIFLTGLSAGKLETLCVNRRNGRILWTRIAPAQKVEPTHRIGSPSCPTPVTDGKMVVSYFGSFGLVAYDMDGTERWKLPLSAPVVEFGTGTSPIIEGGRVILICDQDEGSFLLAVDLRTGKTLWRTERPEFRRSFSSPFIWRHDGETELIVPGSIWLRSYDLANGKERWSFGGTSRVANSTPTAGDGLLFSSSWNIGGDPGDRITMDPFESFAREHDKNNDGKFSRDELPAGPIRDRFSQMDVNKDGVVLQSEWEMMREMFTKAGNAVLAIKPGGRGDITTTHLAWKSTRSLPYVCSPVFYRGRLYTVKNGGLVSCYEAKTGRALYQDERLDAAGDYYASLVAAGGHIYAASQKGVITVWKAGDELKILARNTLGEPIMATPAVVEGHLIVRTEKHLYCFGVPLPGSPGLR